MIFKKGEKTYMMHVVIDYMERPIHQIIVLYLFILSGTSHPQNHCSVFVHDVEHPVHKIIVLYLFMTWNIPSTKSLFSILFIYIEPQAFTLDSDSDSGLHIETAPVQKPAAKPKAAPKKKAAAAEKKGW